MKLTARILALLLASLMLISAVACGGSDNSETTTAAGGDATTTAGGDSTTAATETTTENPYDANGYLKSDLPEDLNFNGETITVLWWNDVEKPEFNVEEVTGELVGDAIWQRNQNVQEKLGIKLEWDDTKGQFNSGVGAAYAQYVGNGYNAGDQTWDLMAAHSRTMALTSQYGYCADMMELDYLNFEMPWWPTVMTETATIGDALYFVTGDCSTNALHMMYTFFYNKDILNEYKLPDPTAMVKEGKWTIEAMETLTKDLYQDLDNSGNESKDDFYGMTTLYWHLDSLWYGSDMMLVAKDEEKLFKISDDFYSEKAIALCDDLGKWCQSDDVYVNSDNYRTPFTTGNALMSVARHKDIIDQILDADFSYGILPAPKYDEAQENYITAVGNPVSFYSIYANTKDADRAAAVLECWAAEAYRTTTPALFETAMKLKYSETSTESEMYDIIRSGITFDIGRLYHEQLQGMIDLFTLCAEAGKSWQAKYAAYKVPLNKSIEKIAKIYIDLQAS